MSELAMLYAKIVSKEYELVDLTAPLSGATPILALPAPFANTIPASLEKVSDFDDDGPMWSWNNIHTGEHTGTHLDAPVHWISGRDGLSVDQIPLTRLIGPIAVLDKTAQAAADPDFVLEIADITAWEEENGPLPEGTWLILKTGWSARADSSETFLNVDDEGSHTPGISAECAKWLADSRPISGFGVETVGIDAGGAAAFDPPFPAHYFLLGADKYGLTQLRNVEKLPTLGAVIIVSPLPIVGGTGSPARVYAIVPAESE